MANNNTAARDLQLAKDINERFHSYAKESIDRASNLLSIIGIVLSILVLASVTLISSDRMPRVDELAVFWKVVIFLSWSFATLFVLAGGNIVISKIKRLHGTINQEFTPDNPNFLRVASYTKLQKVDSKIKKRNSLLKSHILSGIISLICITIISLLFTYNYIILTILFIVFSAVLLFIYFIYIKIKGKRIFKCNFYVVYIVLIVIAIILFVFSKFILNSLGLNAEHNIIITNPIIIYIISGILLLPLVHYILKFTIDYSYLKDYFKDTNITKYEENINGNFSNTVTYEGNKSRNEIDIYEIQKEKDLFIDIEQQCFSLGFGKIGKEVFNGFIKKPYYKLIEAYAQNTQLISIRLFQWDKQIKESYKLFAGSIMILLLVNLFFLIIVLWPNYFKDPSSFSYSHFIKGEGDNYFFPVKIVLSKNNNSDKLPIVILVPDNDGLDYKSNLYNNIQPIRDRGFNVIYYQGRGQYTNNLERSIESGINDLNDVINYVYADKKFNGDNLVLFGLGSGATVALKCAEKHKSAIRCILTWKIPLVYDSLYVTNTVAKCKNNNIKICETSFFIFDNKSLFENINTPIHLLGTQDEEKIYRSDQYLPRKISLIDFLEGKLAKAFKYKLDIVTDELFLMSAKENEKMWDDLTKWINTWLEPR